MPPPYHGIGSVTLGPNGRRLSSSEVSTSRSSLSLQPLLSTLSSNRSNPPPDRPFRCSQSPWEGSLPCSAWYHVVKSRSPDQRGSPSVSHSGFDSILIAS